MDVVNCCQFLSIQTGCRSHLRLYRTSLQSFIYGLKAIKQSNTSWSHLSESLRSKCNQNLQISYTITAVFQWANYIFLYFTSVPSKKSVIIIIIST